MSPTCDAICMRKNRMFRPPPTHRAAVAFENRHADRKHNPAIASHRASNPAFTCISACMSSSPGNSRHERHQNGHHHAHHGQRDARAAVRRSQQIRHGAAIEVAHHQLVRHDQDEHEDEDGQQEPVQVVQHEVDEGGGLHRHAERRKHLGHALHHGIQAFSQLRIVHADDHADVHGQHRRDDEADEQVRAQLFGEQRPIHESLLSPPGSSCRTGA